MRNWAREKFDNVAGRYGINDIMGDNAKFLSEVRIELQKELEPIGVDLIQFGFIGAPRPPQAVMDSINLSVQATQIAQQKQNELVQSQADAAKEVAKAEGDAKAVIVNAEAQAKANTLLSNSITPTLVNYRMLDKWNGVMPQVQAGNGGIMLQLPAQK
jgi:regulator of protease activity HflC (stomatin/prohibitin superfamily)